MLGRRRGRGNDSGAEGTAGDGTADAGRQAGKTPVHGPDAEGARRLQHGVTQLSRWTVRLLIIGVGLFALFWLMGQLWSILLPILFGLLLATILWPPVRLMRKKLPHSLAALIAILGAVPGGQRAGRGARSAGHLAGPGPGRPGDGRSGVPAGVGRRAAVQLRSGRPRWTDRQGHQPSSRPTARRSPASCIGSLGAIGSAVVTLVLALVLCFFFLKDGPRFLPWLRTWIGAGTGQHIEVLSDRVWTALGQYVWSQAAVALVDGVFIGIGVWLLGVPFALPIAVLTFFGGFVPIVGAFVAGAVATLVALVSNGVWTAVAVLAIVLVVQQLEGNVMQPILVGRTLKIHAAVVLTSVALGGTLFGIVGAFLAVPAVAAFQVITRYVREQLEKPATTPSAVITDLTPAQEPHSPVNE